MKVTKAAVQCEHCGRWHNVSDNTYIYIMGDIFLGGGEGRNYCLTEPVGAGEEKGHIFCREPHCLLSPYVFLLDMSLYRREINPKKKDEEKKEKEPENEKKEEEPKSYIDVLALYANSHDKTPRKIFLLKKNSPREYFKMRRKAQVQGSGNSDESIIIKEQSLGDDEPDNPEKGNEEVI